MTYRVNLAIIVTWNISMKTRYKVLIGIAMVILLIMIAMIIAFNNIEKNLSHLADIDITEPEMNTISDGTYRGSYSAFPVSAIVDVTAQNSKIIEIRIVKHVHGQGSEAEVITDDVISRQSVNVESISGATYSSKVILLAIQDALTF